GRRRHTRSKRDWSSDVCSSDLFRKATGITAEPPERETRTNAQLIDDVWQNRDRDYNVRLLVRRLQRIEKQMSGDARDQFAAYIRSEERRVGKEGSTGGARECEK